MRVGLPLHAAAQLAPAHFNRGDDTVQKSRPALVAGADQLSRNQASSMQGCGSVWGEASPGFRPRNRLLLLRWVSQSIKGDVGVVPGNEQCFVFSKLSF